MTHRFLTFSIRLLLGVLICSSAADLTCPSAIGVEASSEQATSALTPLMPEYLRFQGLRRLFRLYQPKSLAEHPAVIIALHGSGGDGERFRRQTDGAFDRLADQRGWLVAYPDALGGQWSDCRARAPCHSPLAGVDDIAFFRAVVRHVKEVTGKQLAGVFAVGYSNGGHLVFRIALEAPSDFAAFAVIDAYLPVPNEGDCAASRQPISILLVSGTDDAINPWAGGDVQPPGGESPGRVVSAEATATYFKNLAGLAGEPTVERCADRDINDGAWVETQQWAAAGHAEVVMMVVHGGGHTLPHPTAPFPTSLVGRISRHINGARTICSFFERHLHEQLK